MVREGEAALRYAARGKGAFFDLRSPELRDAVELRILHFVETATILSRPFRKANPLVPWAAVDELRNNLVHEYWEIKAEKIWRFVEDDLPALMSKLKRARFTEA
jgi:uncharacterized protein with HEPN domain